MHPKSSHAGQVIAACCGGMALAITVLATLVGTGVIGGETKLTLFADGYKVGEELAGFSGRPMVLVFADRGDPAWTTFLLACEADPDIAALLRSSFVGVVVDFVGEPDTVATYDIPKTGMLIVKDIHGPLLGLLQPGFGLKELREMLVAIAPTLMIERSTIYAEMLARGPVVLEDMVKSNLTDTARLAYRGLEKFEPGLPNLSAFSDKATELGLK